MLWEKYIYINLDYLVPSYLYDYYDEHTLLNFMIINVSFLLVEDKCVSTCENNHIETILLTMIS